MKLLLDQNISRKLVNRIASIYPNSEHVYTLGLLTASDMQIWKYAKKKGCVIVTYDSDFDDLSTIFGHPPKVIRLRMGNTSTKHICRALIANRRQIKEFYEDKSSGILHLY